MFDSEQKNGTKDEYRGDQDAKRLIWEVAGEDRIKKKDKCM